MIALSRRSFLATSAMAVSGALLSTPHRAAGEEQASIAAYGGFRMGMASYSLRSYGLGEAIAHTADLGLHWIELFGGHQGVTADGEAITDLLTTLEDHGVELYAYWAGDFREDEEQNRALFEFARRCGVSLLTGHPLPESLPMLEAFVTEYDIKVGVHNHGPGHLYDTVDDMLNAAEPWDERIGFCLDIGHCMRSGEDPVEAVGRLGDRLYGIHLKDHEHIGRDDPAQTIAGEGALDLPALCEALRAINYDAPIMVEYDKEVTVEEIRQGLANVADAANR